MHLAGGSGCLEAISMLRGRIAPGKTEICCFISMRYLHFQILRLSDLAVGRFVASALRRQMNKSIVLLWKGMPRWKAGINCDQHVELYPCIKAALDVLPLQTGVSQDGNVFRTEQKNMELFWITLVKTWQKHVSFRTKLEGGSANSSRTFFFLFNI